MAIRTRVGGAFEIEIEGKEGGGYTWEPDLPAGIELVQRDSVPGKGVGAGGRDRFAFRVTAHGEFTVTMRLRRPWEPQAVEKRTFKIVAT